LLSAGLDLEAIYRGSGSRRHNTLRKIVTGKIVLVIGNKIKYDFAARSRSGQKGVLSGTAG
jgi:hypothetical protein